jgi:alginate O-acetyltransferase complex protein AlgJ
MIKKVLIPVLILMAIGFSNSYTELNINYQRLKSRVTVRKIEKPTAANLDFAAYDRNPILLEALNGKLKKIPGSVSLEKVTFDSTLSNTKDNLSETPITKEEQETPLAWKPLIKKLWNVVKEDKLQQMGSRVASYKWDDPGIYIPYQEITTAYIHEENNQTELWVKIEFANWISFLKNIQDEDNDGFREIYGKLDLSAIHPDTLKKTFDWIKNEYTTKTLNSEDLTDWITDLASYWYPTKNTDILDLGEAALWPLSSTNKKVLKELHGQKFTKPLAVVEGKPVSPDKPIYNVYIVDTGKLIGKTVETVVKELSPDAPVSMDTSLSVNFKTNGDRFKKENSEFGSYENWYKKNSAFLDGTSKWLAAFPAEQMGLEGKNGWLFFRKSFEYMFGKDYSLQVPQKNPVPNLMDFKKYLNEKNVNLLFVVVPNKEEVYFDKIDSGIPSPQIQFVNPYSRKILNDIQNAGIEVIDLLPYFLEARKEDTTGMEYLYQVHDTHWTNRGLQIAAELIANRIKEYAWYDGVEKKACTVKDTMFERQGDIVERLPEQNRSRYQAVKLQARQVLNEDSSLYKGNNPDAPVMLIGDSFTGVFESVDCKGAGVGAHIAQKTSIPVEVITSWGGGPLVRKKAMHTREKYLSKKRLVIYMMVARDLYNYSQNWEKFPE